MTSRLSRSLVASVLASAWLAAPAAAADPIMRLDEVRSGMECTGYSVVRGVEPASFDVEIIDVIGGDPASDRPRLLIEVSGPAVDVTGLGPGFSGSPVYCPDAQGTPRVAGAISESVGEYGGKVALATPIQSVLGVPVEAPAGARRRFLRGRPLAAPLTISGLSPALARGLERIAGRAGHTVLAAPAHAPAGFPQQPLRAGSAMAVGLSGGDLSLSAIGTVTYVDGSRLWGFGHALDGVGSRSLLLQDAYVYRVINSPLQIGGVASTYKLAAAGRTVGALTNDGFSAVAGRIGSAPSTIPVAVRVTDRDTGRRRGVDVHAADETDLGDPGGLSPIGLIAPIAVAEGATAILGASPPRLTGDMCARISLRERTRPLRFCNRYVTDSAATSLLGLGNGVATSAADDVSRALSLVGESPVHIEGISAAVGIRRGASLAQLSGVGMPRRVRPGQRVRVSLEVRLPGGGEARRSFVLRVPAGLSPGSHRLVFVGTDPDGLEDSDFLSFSPQAKAGSAASSARAPGRSELERLAAAVAGIGRDDGVRLRLRGSREGSPVFRDAELRITGRASVRVQVRRARPAQRR